ncbi:hypothetical protein [Nocardioides exalbidus]|uniref:hypothetical protein n=1 Tax=Nocardioides exalbidus TaxID=402596 RepID=UPI0011152FE2|nr:hypothetical protein [Nocardioides exalbidus]
MEPVRIDLGSAVLDGLAKVWGGRVTAFGSKDGAPFIVSFSDAGDPFEAVLPGRGTVTSVAGWERSLVVTHDGQRAHRFEASTPDSGPLSVEPEDIDHVADARRGLEAAKWIWAVCGDEDPLYAVLDEGGWLRALDFNSGDWMPDSSGLRLASPDQLPLVNQGDSTLYIAGRFSSQGADPALPTMWMLNEYGTKQLNPHVRFTEISDVSDYDDAWFAGSLDGRPQLVTTEGDLGPVPDVDLDPIAPTVLVASRQYQYDTVGIRLVLQTVHGIQLWTSTADGWLREDLPGNVLQAARCDSSTSLWYVADHELRHVTL